MLLIVLKMRIPIRASIRSLRPDRRATTVRVYRREKIGIGVSRFPSCYRCFRVLVAVGVERLNALSPICGLGRVGIVVADILLQIHLSRAYRSNMWRVLIMPSPSGFAGRASMERQILRSRQLKVWRFLLSRQSIQWPVVKSSVWTVCEDEERKSERI